MQRVAKAAARRAAKAAARKAAIAKSKAGQSARNKSKHAAPEETAIEQLRIAKGVKAVKAVNAAARKAANAKGVATKKGGKGVVRGALAVMLMTAGCVNAAKQADAAAEQLRVEHEEFVVEEQRIGKAIEADEGAYRPRIQERNAKAIEKAAEKKAKEQGFLNVHYIGQRAPCKHGCGAEVWPGEANLCCRGGKYILNADCNPPLDDAYLDLITRPRYSQQSRALNGGLAMASQGIYPSKALGGVGWHEQAYGHLALFGKTYLTMHEQAYGHLALSGKTYLTMRDLGSNAFGHLALTGLQCQQWLSLLSDCDTYLFCPPRT